MCYREKCYVHAICEIALRVMYGVRVALGFRIEHRACLFHIKTGSGPTNMPEVHAIEAFYAHY